MQRASVSRRTARSDACSRRRRLLVVLAMAFGWGVLSGWQERTLKQPSGVLAPGMPRQIDIAQDAQLQRADIALSTRSEFDLAARVLSRSGYRCDDGAKLAPVDRAPGWRCRSGSAPCWPTSRATGPRGFITGLQGFLVDAQRTDGWRWGTSPTRKDTGAGACEPNYVKSIQPAALP